MIVSKALIDMGKVFVSGKSEASAYFFFIKGNLIDGMIVSKPVSHCLRNSHRQILELELILPAAHGLTPRWPSRRRLWHRRHHLQCRACEIPSPGLHWPSPCTHWLQFLYFLHNLIMFIPNFSHQLLDNVFHRNNAQCTAVLIGYNCKMRRPAADGSLT